MGKPCIFLDRDGVLVATHPEGDTTRGPRSLTELEFLPGVVEACNVLAAHGCLLVCVTNQPDVARAKVRRADVENINSVVQRALQLAAVYTCFHDELDDCTCRKPKPGLLRQASLALQIELGHSSMVGDREADMVAGRLAGCHNVVRIGQPDAEADYWAPTLLAAVPWLLSHDF